MGCGANKQQAQEVEIQPPQTMFLKSETAKQESAIFESVEVISPSDITMKREDLSIGNHDLE